MFICRNKMIFFIKSFIYCKLDITKKKKYSLFYLENLASVFVMMKSSVNGALIESLSACAQITIKSVLPVFLMFLETPGEIRTTLPSETLTTLSLSWNSPAPETMM